MICLASTEARLPLKRGGESGARGDGTRRLHQRGDGRRSNRRQLRGAIRAEYPVVKEEQPRAHQRVHEEMPDVMPRRNGEKAPGKGRVEQAIEQRRPEQQHAENAGEDREVEVSAARGGAALLVVESPARLPP